MKHAQDILDPAKIDLSRDALIEASAGTGKTYTLTMLVIRMIKEKAYRYPLESILVVTFTEKAAGEMKERIRAELDNAIRSGRFNGEELTPDELGRFRRAALDYDRASIQTIHSFCYNTLQRHAFENGFHFELEQIDDRETALEVLRGELARVKTEHDEEWTEFLIQLSGFSKGSDYTRSWEDNLISLALSHNPGHSVIRPQGVDFWAQAKDAAARLKALAKKTDFSAIAPTLRSNATTQMARCRDLHTLLGRGASMAEIHQTVNLASAISMPTNKASAEQKQAVEEFNSISEDFAAAGAAFFASLAERVHTGLSVLKEERRQISFNDMLSRVERGLDRNRLLEESLRERYNVALVDEFQDTDPVQWTIFRRVFLEADDRRLFIIGDPKQAIYSFRGADIHTYYQAAQTIKDRIKDGTAAWYRLPVNRRSAPEAISAANVFFKEYFRRPDDAPEWKAFTPFDDSLAPDEPRFVLINAPGEAGLFSAHIEGEMSANTARLEAASRIAADCLRLLRSGIRISREKGEAGRLRPGDICILTRKKNTAKMMEQELIRYGIPCSIYKKQGIYASPEALHISIVLRFLAAIEDTDLTKMALLTPFFRREAGTLPAVPEPESDEGEWIRRLHKLAERRHWGELFAVLLSMAGPAVYASDTGPRSLTNYEQIFQNLENSAVTSGLDIHRLSAHLQRLITNQQDAGEDEDLHRIESDESAVQIMTIHASKGLEFPFVYITSPLEDVSAPTSPWYMFNDGATRIYDLLKSKENEDRHKHELEEENKRLIYVAMTRGIFRTTIFRFDKSKTPGIELTADLPASCPEKAAPGDRYDISETAPRIPLPDPLVKKPGDFEETGHKSRRISLASFSSITGSAAGRLNFGETEREDDEPEAAPAVPEAEGTIFLPRGPKTGNLLHSLLERIDFAWATKTEKDFRESAKGLVRSAWLRSRIRPVKAWFARNPKYNEKTLNKETITDAATDVICRILFSALNTPLETSDGKKFHLKDIAPGARRHELEFHFKAGKKIGLTYPEISAEFPRGLITGFIDLVFRYEDNYYILDWKSNWLPAYDRPNLQNGMNAHHYDIQAAIYSEALRRWLKKSGKKPAPVLDRVYYLFLRGLDSGGSGVYATAPPELPQFKEDLHG